ncbi:hypothetical protein PG993_005723 [Apiospora rasikravindrae]|uniref:Nephrocystin 3-like N-terminal domain-containing protein n=1 Tax=Apiospora rasikravindrae TaxID=990691 RepID=A0ABR1TC71_9PEZI
MAQLPDQPSAEFQAAKESFLGTLSPAERSQFSALCNQASPEQLLESVKPFSHRFKKERWAKVFEKIRGFTEALTPYFNVIGIVVSSHPEVAAIAVKRTPVVITQLMWQPFEAKMENLKKRFKWHTDMVRDEIRLLQLYQSAKNDVALARQEQHIQSVLEASVVQAAIAHDTGRDVRKLCEKLENMEKQYKSEEYERREYEKLLSQGSDKPPTNRDPMNEIMSFVQPPVFIQDNIIDNLTTSPGEGGETRSVLYFFFNSNESLKSMDQMYRALLAQMIDSHVDLKAVATSTDYVLSRRQQGQVRGSPLLIRDLFFIILGRLPNGYIVIDAIDECEPDARYEEHDQALREELQILRDGIATSGAKLLVLSRPSVWGLSNLSTDLPIQSLHMTPAMVSGDLERHCHNGLQALCDNGYLPAMGSTLLQELSDTLLTGADGMFLWVRLMFSYLRSPVLAPPHLAPTVRLRAIRSLRYPECLDQIYCRILSLIWAMPTYPRQLARQVFMWLLFSKKPCLDPSELHTFLSAMFYFASSNQTSLISSNVSHDILNEDFKAFRETILMACSSLVELGSTGYYRFIHSTTSEFLLTRLWSPDCLGMSHMQPSVRQYFQLCKSETEMELCSACLRYLQQFVPAKPLSGNILQSASRGYVSRKYRFASYASAYWTAHLKHAGVSQRCGHSGSEEIVTTLVQTVRQFLDSQLNVNSWIELVYLLGDPAVTVRQHENLRQSIPSICGQGGRTGLHLDFRESLTRLSHDLSLLEKEWGVALRAAPNEIWNDVTAFLPSPFFKQTTATTIRHIGLDDPLDPSQSAKPLAIISMSDSTQSFLAKLSIWPSKAFQDSWSDIATMHKSCSGWTARYQLWGTSSEATRLIQEYSIQLDENEVSLQVQRLMRRPHNSKPSHGRLWENRSVDDELQLGFPILISRHDLNTFVILRTVYKLVRVGDSPPGVRFDSYVVPLDFNARLASIWSPERPDSTKHMGSSVTYDYGFDFGNRDQYLLYRDNLGMQVQPKGVDVATTIAVFRLSLFGNTNRPPIFLLNRLVLQEEFVYYSAWSFHPALPILAVQEAGRCAPILWSFLDGILEQTNVLGRRTLRGLRFSSCGRSLVVDDDLDVYPSVHSITHMRSYQKHYALGMENYNNEQNALAVVEPATRRGILICQGGSTLQSQDIQHYTDIRAKAVLQRLQVQGSALEVTQWGNREMSVQSLVSLPAVENLNYLDASIKVPGMGRERLQVVLNKNPRPVYSMLDEPDRHFPAVILKDQRAIPRAVKRQIEGRVPQVDKNHVAKYRRVDETL